MVIDFHKARFAQLRKNIRTVAMWGAVTASMLGATGLSQSANAQSKPQPTYDLAIVCASYYAVVYFYANQQNPGTEQTNAVKGRAVDWTRLASGKNTTNNFDVHFDAAQQQMNELILDDDRKAELAQIQQYCLNTGIALFGWDQS